MQEIKCPNCGTVFQVDESAISVYGLAGSRDGT